MIWIAIFTAIFSSLFVAFFGAAAARKKRKEQDGMKRFNEQADAWKKFTDKKNRK